MFNIKKCLIFILLPLFLIGCGGENEEQLPQEIVAINAQDLLTFAPIKNTQVVDLRNKVTAENNQSLIIESVESIDNKCSFNENDIEGLTFKVTTTDSENVCRFKYNVKPASSQYKGTSEAIVQVVVTKDYTRGDFLPPVSRTVIEGGLLTLNSKDLLIESGFEIDPTSVYLIGDTGSSDIGMIAGVDASSIKYQAPAATTGTVRIFYTEIDSIKNIARPGIIYIAIGQESNHSPIALDQRIDALDRREVDIPIDISSYISDPDGDDIQLIDTKSITGRVIIDSPHSFLYTPGSSGKEVITYIVSDHNGGYGIGLLTFDVNEYKSIVDSVQNLTFTPPLTFNQLSVIDGVYTDSYKELGFTGYTGLYPTFSKDLAEAYCKTKGMKLASLAELKAMRTNVLADMPIFQTDYRWHSGIKYLTHDANAISLETGSTASVSDGYFSCTNDLTAHGWEFLDPYYSGLFNTPTKIYITSKTAGDSIFLPADDYNLTYKFEALSVDGILIDTALASTYLSVSISGNTITVTKKSNAHAIAATLEISDIIAPSTKTKLILGVSLCPLTVTPPVADELSCILILHPKKGYDASGTEAFSTALSNNMLTILGMKKEKIHSLGSKQVGKGITKFQTIRWGDKNTTYSHRKNWLEKLQLACDAMSKLKVDGRDNWVVGANNIKPQRGTATRTAFLIPSAEYRPAKDFVEWMWKQDGRTEYVGNYGLGYANADPKVTTYVNQSTTTTTFLQQSAYVPETYTFPSCWSKN
ncbi:Ig-like domain-containing protein [Photobacterium piscicola]|uniref:Ig-like domain-containing protein n=1 Tax=Photobacterium piscicola TaxID=1378299 RepID=UPI0038CF2FF6